MRTNNPYYNRQIKAHPLYHGKQLRAPETDLRTIGDDKNPVFSFQFIDPKFSITECQNDDKIKFITRIVKLSTMTWGDIKRSPRHQYGTEKIYRDSLRIKIPDHITPDTAILALRFSELKPMLGYRDRDVFHIIGCDDKFKAYDHS